MNLVLMVQDCKLESKNLEIDLPFAFMASQKYILCAERTGAGEFMFNHTFQQEKVAMKSVLLTMRSYFKGILWTKYRRLKK